MLTFINLLISMALAAVVVTLIYGVVTMARGGAAAKQKSNIIMRWRVGLQALAIIALLIGFYLKAKMRSG